MKRQLDLNNSPWITIWETTRACDVACPEYGEKILAHADPLELSTTEAEQLIRDVAELAPRIFLLTGADPLKRDDIYHLVTHAANLHLRPALALRATPLLTRCAIFKLKQSGLSRLTLSLDGSSAELHDLIAAAYGSYARTIEATQWADDAKLPFQITTRLCEHNLHDLEKLAAMLRPFRIVQWNVAFPVPARPANSGAMLSARQFEEAFARLYKIAQHVPFKVRTSEARHYRRYVLQQQVAARADAVAPGEALFAEGIPGILAVNDEQATVFIAQNGEVYPGTCLPVAAGNARIQRLMEIYQGSRLFESLRDASNLKGKCGFCGFKQVCGGSRARAFAGHGDMFHEDPACIYRPPQSEPHRGDSRSLMNLE